MNNQSIIRLIIFMMLFMGLLASMSSCTSGSAQKPENSIMTGSRDVILKGKDISSGIKRALVIDSTLNVYSSGDTVWVYRNRITQNTWDKSYKNIYQSHQFKLFVIIK